MPIQEKNSYLNKLENTDKHSAQLVSTVARESPQKKKSNPCVFLMGNIFMGIVSTVHLLQIFRSST